jgi:hypothetical protein
MDSILLRAFQMQVMLQCEYVRISADRITALLAQRPRRGHTNVPLFFEIQNLLNAAANISKALWGVARDKEAKAARKPLRESVGVRDDSPIRVVQMRNNFEHFDGRIDEWWKKSKAHNVCDLNVGLKEWVVGIDEIDMFRQFDPKDRTLTFWSQEFDLQAIIDEALRISQKLEAILPISYRTGDLRGKDPGWPTSAP